MGTVTRLIQHLSWISKSLESDEENSSEKGKLIPTGSWVAIVNEKAELEANILVYLHRPCSADIG
ncbi:hypothetical protein H6F89_04155 [Cyanobacteria bacterium FACHB-63]|nr:hypothetical protein [Cyanobacteria bacterium FACHB-63]